MVDLLVQVRDCSRLNNYIGQIQWMFRDFVQSQSRDSFQVRIRLLESQHNGRNATWFSYCSCQSLIMLWYIGQSPNRWFFDSRIELLHTNGQRLQYATVNDRLRKWTWMLCQWSQNKTSRFFIKYILLTQRHHQLRENLILYDCLCHFLRVVCDSSQRKGSTVLNGYSGVQE